MRVPTLDRNDATITQIQNLTNQQALLQKQVSTGQRLFQPSDDPAAAGRLLNWDSESRQIQQYQLNATAALNVTQSAYAGLSSLNSLATRAGELATLGSGPANGIPNTAYATELNQLIEQASQDANSKFGNNYLFAGTALDAAPYTLTRDPTSGQITSVAYVGNSNQANVNLSETTAVAPGTPGTTNLGIRDFINQLISLRDALATSDTAGIASAGQAIVASGDSLGDAIGDNGAIQLRIQAAQSQLTGRSQNVGQLASNEVNVDMASSIVKLNQAATAYQAALSSASKVLQMSLLDYIK